MAKKPSYDPEEIRYPDQIIVSSPLVPEMEQSYIEYAMSVIVGRALPDVRDGLKPVHRRILYAMYEDNLTHDRPFKKSATCVGDVLGRYHPHGDASVYDAMVRLAQDVSMRYPLVDGQGNFGSIDGDPPAAYRYTEARMSRISDEMLRDIEKETVDWDPNFDESRKEPRVLPSRFPNLLVNGSSGIAVGMATNIPPHNLTEVINAAICVLDDPEATLGDLMEHVQGPDFPTRGIIMGRAGIRAAYATGRGKITVRARHEFEEFGKDRTRIIITELPYQVNKRMLIKNMAEQVEDKRLEGISDLRDESDRNGMRIVIELKRDANAQVVLNRLFNQTQLQTTLVIGIVGDTLSVDADCTGIAGTQSDGDAFAGAVGGGVGVIGFGECVQRLKCANLLIQGIERLVGGSGDGAQGVHHGQNQEDDTHHGGNTTVKLEGEEYVIVRQSDILAIVE